MESAAALALPDLANQSKEKVVQNTTHIANFNPIDGGSWMISFSSSSRRNPSGEEQRVVNSRRDCSFDSV